MTDHIFAPFTRANRRADGDGKGRQGANEMLLAEPATRLSPRGELLASAHVAKLVSRGRC
jgi:hypothetical protein